MDGHALIDFGDGARLERFGDFVLDRPCPVATTPPAGSERWRTTDLRYRPGGGWTAPIRGGRQHSTQLPATWQIRLAELTLELRTADGGQIGLFPEHLSTIRWIEDAVRSRATGSPPEVLNLFAHTGLATLTAARAGAAVVHVDAARTAVAWARRNAAHSGLADKPIRWLVDDAVAFTAREARRGRRYDGVILDPPSYGHAGNRVWRLETDLGRLLEACRVILAPDGFLLLTAHTEGIDHEALRRTLAGAALMREGSLVESGGLRLVSEDGRVLELGAFARWDGRAS
jgi:23S rRNA (cytosine1962-C5)-methyltransferase